MQQRLIDFFRCAHFMPSHTFPKEGETKTCKLETDYSLMRSSKWNKYTYICAYMYIAPNPYFNV